MTVLVVLALISIALAMSYSILRSQMTGIQLQANSDRTDRARMTALAGLNAALRSMRLNSWTGVATPLSGSLNSTDSYYVTFTVGDSSLVSGTAAYSEYPYRVTVLSTGTSVDPAQTSVSSQYKVQAVMKLIPRQTSAVPSNWSTMLAYTIYQMTNSSVFLSVPCHIEGPVRVQSGINITDQYYWLDSPRARYYSDLNLMRSGNNEVQTITRFGGVSGSFTVTCKGATTGAIAYNASSTTMQNALAALSTVGSGNVSVSGGTSTWTVTFLGQLAATNVPVMAVNFANLNGFGASVSVATNSQGIVGTADYRPFSGPIYAPTILSTTKNLGLLTSQLALTVNNISLVGTTPPPMGTVGTYRLYTGGPTYNLTALPASLSGTTLTPDPVTNPLGIYYNSGNVTLGSNVTITGTVVTGLDLTITGTNVRILPMDLPAVEGTTPPVRLPSVVALDDLRVLSGAKPRSMASSTLAAISTSTRASKARRSRLPAMSSSDPTSSSTGATNGRRTVAANGTPFIPISKRSSAFPPGIRFFRSGCRARRAAVIPRRSLSPRIPARLSRSGRT